MKAGARLAGDRMLAAGPAAANYIPAGQVNCAQLCPKWAKNKKSQPCRRPKYHLIATIAINALARPNSSSSSLVAQVKLLVAKHKETPASIDQSETQWPDLAPARRVLLLANRPVQSGPVRCQSIRYQWIRSDPIRHDQAKRLDRLNSLGVTSIIVAMGPYKGA